MKFTCNQENLLLGVSIVYKAVSNKNTIPILGGIYLEATSDNKLILRATDLEVGIEHILNVNTITPGKTVIPAKYLADMVRKLPNTEIDIQMQNESILITYEKSKLNINTYPVDEFPNLPVIDNICVFTLAADIFKKSIRQVSIAASQDHSRPIFSGILMEFKGESDLTLVATDTHRLTLKREKVKMIEKTEHDDPLNIIVPNKVLLEISKLIDNESIIHLIIGKNNQVVFKFGFTSIYSRLIQGQFPNYKQVIPTNFKSDIKINTKLLTDALERAALLVSEENNKRTNNIKLTFQGNTLFIDSYAAEVGNIHEELSVDIVGEELEISFNARYLLDVLKVIEDDSILFKFTGSLSPAIIEPSSKTNYIYLVLPVRSS